MSVLRHIVLKDASNNPVSYNIGGNAEDIYYDPINEAGVDIKTKIDGKAASNHSHEGASTTANGFMTSAQVTKLDAAQPKQLSSTISIEGTDVVTVETALAALNNNKAGKGVATTAANGLMSAADKTKLDGDQSQTLNTTLTIGGEVRHTVEEALGALNTYKANSSDVTTSLASKLNTSGGTISGELTVNERLRLGNGDYISKITFSTTDLTPGTSTLAVGELYFVYGG